MEKVTGYTNLFRRRATYYFRTRVPKDIIDSYGKEEEKFSLKTKDKNQAIKSVHVAAREVDLKFAHHRKYIENKSRPLSEVVTDELLDQIKGVGYWASLKMDEDIRTHGLPDFENNQVIPFKDLFDKFDQSLQEKLPLNRKAYGRGEFDRFIEMAIFFIDHCYGVTVDETSPEAQKVARAFQESRLQAEEALAKRNEGSIVQTPVLPPPTASDSSADSNVSLLSEVVEKWIEDKSRVSWTDKTAQDHRRWVSSFISMRGDRPFNSYGKADAMAFKELLLRLPSNWSKKAVLKDLGIDKAAESAQLLGMEPMSAKNARKVFQYVGSLWRWLFAHYDELEKNIFEGITIEVKSDKRKERDKFTVGNLNTIFQSPIYTGCKSESRWHQEGSYSMKGMAKFWVPLIGLYTGARLGEILQLYTSDIKEDNGVHYFDINSDGKDKTLKTRTSERKVPIHQILVDVGFLDHVNMRKKQGEERVFSDVAISSDGSYSDSFSKFFSRFLKEMRVKTAKNSFHSFRHTFEDACREAGIPKEIMDALQGHSEQGMSGRYGDGYSLQKLNEGLQKVGYCELRIKGRIIR